MSAEQGVPASEIIAAFGGIRPMAHRLDVPVSTVQGWKQRDSIPEARVDEIRAAAAAAGLVLPGEAVPESEGPPQDATEAGDDASPGDRETSMDQDRDKPAEAAAPAQEGPAQEGPAQEGLRETGAAPAAQAAPPAAPAGGPAGRGATLLALLALLLAIGSAGWLWWSTEGPGAAPVAAPSDPGRAARESLARAIEELRSQIEARGGAAVDLAPLEERLGALASQVESLREAMPAEGGAGGGDSALVGAVAELDEGQAKATDDIARLSSAVATVERRIDDLSARLDAAAGNEAERAALADRIAALEESQAQHDDAMTDAVALSLAAGQLRRAIAEGEPYSEALAAARAIADDQADVGGPLGVLAAHAGTGVATRESLRREFPDMARAALAAGDVAAAGSWGERLLRRAGEVVSIRRVGPDVEGETAEARLARAEHELATGNLSRAVDEVGALEGAAAASAQAWLEKARAVRDVEKALDAMERVALAQLRAAVGG